MQIHKFTREVDYESDALPSLCAAPSCLRDPVPGRRLCQKCEDKRAKKKLKAPIKPRMAMGPTRFPARDMAFVYAIGPDGDAPVKIGRTRDLDARFKALQAASPVALKVLGCIVAHASVELELHEYLADYREHGEWFRREGKVLQILEHMKHSDSEGVQTVLHLAARWFSY